jgi:hypothetical protein
MANFSSMYEKNKSLEDNFAKVVTTDTLWD